MKQKFASLFEGKRKYYWLLLGIVLLLLHTYFYGIFSYPQGDDTTFHLANIQAIESQLDFLHFKFFPSPILPDIAGNFGYGVGIFYPRLPHYLAAVITHVLSPLGVTAAIGLKITHILLLFLSALVIFKLTNKIWKNDKVSFFASVFYITSTYMISDIIIRDAFAECFQFLFLPMVILGCYELFYGKVKNFYFYFVLGYLGMVHTHLVMTMYLTLIPVIFLLVHIKETFTWKYLKHLLIAACFIIIVSLPAVIPMIEHKIVGGYAVFEENIISSTGLVHASALNPLSYLLPRFDNKHIESYLLIPVIVLLIITIKNHRKIFKDYKKLWISFLAILITFFILSSKIIPWQYAPQFLAMIQFPWRLEIGVIFIVAILAGSCFMIIKLSHKQEIILVIITIALAFLPTFPLHRFLSKSDIQNLSISDKGTGWSREYLPIEAWNNWNESIIPQNDNKIRIIEGEAVITNQSNDLPQVSFDITANGKVVLEIPQLYYLGYEITKTDNHQTNIIPYVKSSHGFILVTLEGSGHVDIDYVGTKIDTITQYMALIIGSFGAVTYILYFKKEH